MSNGWTTSRRQVLSVNNRESTSRYNFFLRRHGPPADGSTRFGCVVPCKEQARNRRGDSADVFHSRRLVLHAIQTPALASPPIGQTQRRGLLCPLLLGEGARGHNNCDRACTSSHDVKQPVSFPRPHFCVRALPLCFTHPRRGVGGAPRDVRVLGGTPVGVHVTRHARRLARRLASHDAGRTPPGAPPWRFWALRVPRFPPRVTRLGLSFGGSGSVTASSSRPGLSAWRAGSLPPGATVASRYRRTPHFAPPFVTPVTFSTKK
jgi:hypothetical protein